MADDPTRSNDPVLVASRVFIGNCPTDKVSQEDLQFIYEKYGPVLGVKILRGFAFVQFGVVEHAVRAVQGERGSMLHGVRIDVRLAAEGRRNLAAGPGGLMPPPGGALMGGNMPNNAMAPFNMPQHHPDQPFGQRPPNALMGGGGGPMMGGQQQQQPMQMQLEQQHRQQQMPPVSQQQQQQQYPPAAAAGLALFENNNSYNNNNNMASQQREADLEFRGQRTGIDRDNGGPGAAERVSRFDQQQQSAARHDYAAHHPTNNNNGSLDRSYDREDRLREIAASKTAAAVPPPPQANVPQKATDVGVERPYDAIILVQDKASRLDLVAYAESVERRLLELSLVVDVVYVVKAEQLSAAADSLCKRGCVYLLVVDQAAARHCLVTLKILHHKPVVHRNIALDDCMQLLQRDFAAYLGGLRAGSEQPSMSFLLHLLADGKHLSEPELARIITHLRDRSSSLVPQQQQQVKPQVEAPTAVSAAAAVSAAQPISSSQPPFSMPQQQQQRQQPQQPQQQQQQQTSPQHPAAAAAAAVGAQPNAAGGANIQSKIFNILNDAPHQQQQQQQQQQQTQQQQQQTQQQDLVSRALQNLIANKDSLYSLTTSQGQQPQQPPPQSVAAAALQQQQQPMFTAQQQQLLQQQMMQQRQQQQQPQQAAAAAAAAANYASLQHDALTAAGYRGVYR